MDNGTASANNFKFTGREDDGTGLYYYRARYYDPSTGRFISEDPKGFGAGINFYAYTSNNPINGNDPSGEEGVGYVGLAGFGVGAVVGGATSYATQYYQNNGTVDWNKVGISAATGGLAGALLTTSYGQKLVGVAGIGASTNLLNYGLTTPSSEFSTAGATAAVVSGAVGGLIGGKTPNPYMFITPSPFLNDVGMVAQMIAPKVLGMGTLGGLVGSYDYTQATPAPSIPSPSTPVTPSTGSSFGSSFMDVVNSNPGAAGGFLLYPNKPNLNQLQNVYAK